MPLLDKQQNFQNGRHTSWLRFYSTARSSDLSSMAVYGRTWSVAPINCTDRVLERGDSLAGS
jgi:hypothetical protein